MKKNIVLSILLIMAMTCVAWAGEPIMKLSEVKPGMVGIAKTVVHGEKIETFDVKVLDILPGTNDKGRLILIRIGGPLIDKCGGLAAGMSGSPVYINGKVIGAIGFGYDNSDHRIGMVTPIEDMLVLRQLADKQETQRLEQERFRQENLRLYREEQAKKNETSKADEKAADGVAGSDKAKSAWLGNKADTGVKGSPEGKTGADGKADEKAKNGNAEQNKDKTAWLGRKAKGKNDSGEKNIAPDDKKEAAEKQDDKAEAKKEETSADKDETIVIDEKKIKPIATPLIVNGLSPRALSFLENKLRAENIVVLGGQNSGKITTKNPLRPGSAISVQLAEGYVEAGSVGTITYMDGKNIYAFGHSTLDEGNINYPVGTAYVHQVITNTKSPFKLASSGQIVGRALQDRSAGLFCRLGEKAPTVLVRLDVTDHDLGKTDKMYFNVVRDEKLEVALITSGLLGLLDNSLDRRGDGTSKVSFTIKGADLPDGKLERTNMFYSDSDVAAVSLLETAELLNLITSNVYSESPLEEIALKVDVERLRRTATVQSAEAEKDTVKPGETVKVAVEYIPYRGTPLVTVIDVAIPKDMPEGDVTLNIYGGNLPPVDIETVDMSSAAMITPQPLPYKDLAEMLEEPMKTDKNNEIIIEEMTSLINKAGASSAKRNEKQESKKAIGELRDDTAKLILPMKSIEKGSKIKATWESHYIMEGYATVTIKVKK